MRSVAHLLLVAACLAACAQRPRMEPPPATPSRPASARDPPRVSAVSDPVDCSPPWESPRPPTRSGPHLEAQPELPPPERRPTPPLEQWDSTNRTFLEAMKAVCDVIYADVTVGGHTLLACASCAIGPTGAPPRPFTAGGGESDRRRFFVDFTPGSFTRAGADEAVVSLSGCEPAADISFMTGLPGYGNALVEKRGGRYHLVGYLGRGGSCKETRRREDRKTYVCVNWDRRAERWVSLLDWNAKPATTEILRLSAPRPTDEICDQSDHADVGELALEDFDGDDQDGDGIGDVRVRAKLIAWPRDVVAAARAVPDFAAACACEKATRDWVNRVKPGCRCHPVIDLGAKTTQAVELSFITRRGKMVPTPATLDALALLRRYQIVPVEPAASARR